ECQQRTVSSSVLAAIMVEVDKHREEFGKTPAHDDRLTGGELVTAASRVLKEAADAEIPGDAGWIQTLADESVKHSMQRRIEVAMALLFRELERLERAARRGPHARDLGKP